MGDSDQEKDDGTSVDMREAGRMRQRGVIRRKIAAAAPPSVGAEGLPGADRGWRLSLARAARDSARVQLEIRALTQIRLSLAELLELPEDMALIALLEGPGEGLGLMILSPATHSALVESQTSGRVAVAAPVPRRPTRTDAAMVAPLIDNALVRLEDALAEEEDLIWAGGFRYASFLEDARPLPLLLEDGDYRVLDARLSLGEGGREGRILLALPAEGQGRRLRPADTASPAAPDAGQDPQNFTEALTDRVAGAGCVLDAVLARLSLPLARVTGLQEGELLTLPGGMLDRIGFEGVDARRLAEGKLGQSRGMRAVRLNPTAAQGQENTPAVLLRVAG